MQNKAEKNANFRYHPSAISEHENNAQIFIFNIEREREMEKKILHNFIYGNPQLIFR